MAHDPRNNACPQNADPRNETCSCSESPERGGSDKDTVDLTPRGYKVPGGPSRIDKAQNEFYDTKCAVSNFFTQLLKELYGSNPQVAAKAFAKRINHRGERLYVDPEHLASLLEKEADAQEEVLRAISGNPPMRKRTDPEPVCTIVDA